MSANDMAAQVARLQQDPVFYKSTAKITTTKKQPKGVTTGDTPLFDAYSSARDAGNTMYKFKGKKLRNHLGIGDQDADDSFLNFLKRL